MSNPEPISNLQALLERGDTVSLKKSCEEDNPAVVAEFLSELDTEQVWHVLALLEIRHRAGIFGCLDIDRQTELVSGRGRQEMAHLLEEMHPDERADLVLQLDDLVRDEILPLVAQAERADIRKLVAYPENTAGAVMTTEYATLPSDVTVREALERLRREAPDKETIYYIYIVDEHRRLKGFISLKDLILSKPDLKVEDVMHEDVIHAGADEDQEEVASKIAKYDLLAIPVVDAGSALVGIVTVDDIVDVIQDEADEDIFHLGAAGEPVDYLKTSVIKIARQRLPWLLILVLVGLVSGFIMEQFDEALVAIGVLLFVPLLMGSGGNAGCQTTTTVVRGLATGELESKDILKILRKEITVALLLGVILAVLAAGRAILMNDNATLGLTVALAMVVTIVTAKSAGALLPVLFKGLGFDPALMSAPLITTIVDISSLLLYLHLARLILIG